jgi:hypothetical protein
MTFLIKRRSVFLALALLSFLSLLDSRELHAALGERVPAFDLIDLAGRQHTYADYEGQILLLFFLGHN